MVADRTLRVGGMPRRKNRRVRPPRNAPGLSVKGIEDDSQGERFTHLARIEGELRQVDSEDLDDSAG